jgi:hypothetical protein
VSAVRVRAKVLGSRRHGGESGDNVEETIEIEVGGVSGAIVDAEAVVDDGGKDAGVTRGLHVDFRVTDEQGFIGAHAEFAKDGIGTEGVGFFGGESVASVDGAEIFGEAESFEDAHADAFGLIGKHGHGHGGKMLEGLGDAGIGAGVVHFVSFVMSEEKFEGAVEFGGRGAEAQGFGDQDGGAVADVAGDDFFGELGALQFAQGGVDGMDQVELGIDEGAVQVENYGAYETEAWGGRVHINILRQSTKKLTVDRFTVAAFGGEFA